MATDHSAMNAQPATDHVGVAAEVGIATISAEAQEGQATEEPVVEEVQEEEEEDWQSESVGHEILTLCRVEGCGLMGSCRRI